MHDSAGGISFFGVICVCGIQQYELLKRLPPFVRLHLSLTTSAIRCGWERRGRGTAWSLDLSRHSLHSSYQHLCLQCVTLTCTVVAVLNCNAHLTGAASLQMTEPDRWSATTFCVHQTCTGRHANGPANQAQRLTLPSEETWAVRWSDHAEEQKVHSTPA